MAVARISSSARFMSLPHPNTRIFNDPKLTGKRRAGQQIEQPGSELQDSVAGPGARPEHDRSGIGVGRVCPQNPHRASH